MSNNDFYVALESNADLQNHPTNSANKFKVTLQVPIYLRGEWEAGLGQIIYPHSWHEKILKNHEDMHNIFAIKLHIDGDGRRKDGTENPASSAYWRSLYIQPTNYHTIKDLLLAIRAACESEKSLQVQFIYRGVKGHPVDTDHVRINTAPKVKLAINLDLARILSFDVDKIKREKWTTGVTVKQLYGGLGVEWLVIMHQYQTIAKEAERQFLPSPLHENIQIKMSSLAQNTGIFQNIYINSDLIQTQFVGNVRANVLRVIAPVQNKGEIETLTFNPIFYFPLRVTKFNTVEINITGDTGELVPFDGGVVVVVLHLRRKHNILV